MEAQVSYIFLSIWNQQNKKPLGSGPHRFSEQGFKSFKAIRSYTSSKNIAIFQKKSHGAVFAKKQGIE